MDIPPIPDGEVSGRYKKAKIILVKLSSIIKDNPIWELVLIGKRKDDPEEKEWIKCRYCPSIVSSPSTVTVIYNHFQSFHSPLLQQVDDMVQKYKDSKPAVVPSKKRKVSEAPFTFAPSIYAPGSNRDKECTDALAGVLAIPHASINLFLNSNMKKLVDVLSGGKYQIPTSHGGLTSILYNREEQVKKKIHKALKSTKLRIAIILDIWTTPGMRNSYLGVTSSSIDESGKIQRLFLGLVNIVGKHSAELVKGEVKKLLESFGITQDSIFKYVTDNGSNMISAFKNSSSQLLVTLPIENSDVFSDEDIPLDKVTEKAAQAVDFEQWLVEFPRRIPCFCHRLSTALFGGCKVLKSMPGWESMSQLIRRFKHSADATQKLKSLSGGSLLSPSNIRWGYWIQVVSRFLDLLEHIRPIAAEKEWTLPSNEEIQTLIAAQPVLKPFDELLRLMQSEKEVTISRAYGFINALLIGLRYHQDHGKSSIFNLAHELEKEVRRCFNHQLDQDCIPYDPVFLVSALLDPNTAKMLSSVECERAKGYLFGMLPKAVDHSPNPPLFQSEAVVPEVVPGVAPGIFELLANMQNQNNNRRSNPPSPMVVKINECVTYILSAKCSLEAPINSLQFWFTLKETEWKEIASLAIEVLVTPASAASIERVYSMGSPAVSKQRNRTGHKLLNSQLFCYLNSHIYNSS